MLITDTKIIYFKFIKKLSFALATDLHTRVNLLLLIPLESFKINLAWIKKNTCNIFEILQNYYFIRSSIVNKDWEFSKYSYLYITLSV